MPYAPTPRRIKRARVDGHRPSATRRGYDVAWRRATRRFIAEQMASGNARCALCGKLITGNRDDVHVDHIVPFRGLDDPLRLDQTNWQLLHPACHGRKTAMDRRGAVSTRGD